MKLNLLLSVAMAVAACGCSGSLQARKCRNIEVVELEHSGIWSKGNVDLIENVYSEDFIGHFPEGTVRGHAGIRSSVEAHRTSFPDWTEVVVDIIADGDRVVTRFTSRGTNLGAFLGNPATGNRVEVSEVCVRRFADGKIVELWVYPDILSMQRQLDAERK
ncbi:MAG: ester cyclase [bacterium]|nr:ester cyclase [bacterium]